MEILGSMKIGRAESLAGAAEKVARGTRRFSSSTDKPYSSRRMGPLDLRPPEVHTQTLAFASDVRPGDIDRCLAQRRRSGAGQPASRQVPAARKQRLAAHGVVRVAAGHASAAPPRLQRPRRAAPARSAWNAFWTSGASPAPSRQPSGLRLDGGRRGDKGDGSFRIPRLVVSAVPSGDRIGALHPLGARLDAPAARRR